MNKLHPQAWDDLVAALSYFPIASLILLRESTNHLIRGRFEDGPNGCIFNMLSRVLPPEERIIDKCSLTRCFTGGSGKIDPKYPLMSEYQPARNLVRLYDYQSCTCTPPDRYGDMTELSVEQLMAFLDIEIQRRLELEVESREVERAARQRLVKR